MQSVIYRRKRMNKSLLLKQLTRYFEQNDLSNPRKTSTCPVAKLLKAELKKANRWKNLNRGKDGFS
jgi:hypothetical protein